MKNPKIRISLFCLGLVWGVLTCAKDSPEEILATFLNVNGTLTINAGETHTSSLTVTLKITYGIGAAMMMLANNPDFIDGKWEVVAKSREWVLTPPADSKLTTFIATVYVKFADELGAIISPVIQASIKIDQTKPTGTLSINNDFRFTNSPAVNLQIRGYDCDSGQTIGETGICTLGYECEVDSDCAEIFPFFFEFLIMSCNEYKQCSFMDVEFPTTSCENHQDCAQLMGLGLCYFGDKLCNSANASQVIEFMVSEDPAFGAAGGGEENWLDYNDPIYGAGEVKQVPYVLSDGAGIKKVYVKFKDAAGNESRPVSSRIERLETVHQAELRLDDKINRAGLPTAYRSIYVPWPSQVEQTTALLATWNDELNRDETWLNTISLENNKTWERQTTDQLWETEDDVFTGIYNPNRAVITTLGKKSAVPECYQTCYEGCYSSCYEGCWDNYKKCVAPCTDEACALECKTVFVNCFGTTCGESTCSHDVWENFYTCAFPMLPAKEPPVVETECNYPDVIYQNQQCQTECTYDCQHDDSCAYYGTFEWSDNTWTERTDLSPLFPSGIDRSCMTLNTDTGNIVFLGYNRSGFNGSEYNYSWTYEYDGNGWGGIATPISPYKREACVMAYDPKLQKVVMIGTGRTETVPSEYFQEPVTLNFRLQRTWVYDGNNWEGLYTPNGPIVTGPDSEVPFIGRYFIALLYYPPLEKVIALVHDDYDGYYLFAFDGTDWEQIDLQITAVDCVDSLYGRRCVPGEYNLEEILPYDFGNTTFFDSLTGHVLIFSDVSRFSISDLYTFWRLIIQ